MGLLVMNEITEILERNGIVTKETFDKIEEYKTAVEWMDTFKYILKAAMKKYNIKKWDSDDYIFSLIPDGTQKRVDTERIKNTMIYIPNAETGELEEVNAYEFFCKNVFVKEHITVREKK